MDISIIVPSYNSAETIEACLCSMAIPKISPQVEITVVDSSSGKREEEIIAQFPEVHLIKRTEKTPAGIARNIGAQAARGELLLFVDADMVLETGSFCKIWDQYQQGHEIFSGTMELKQDVRDIGMFFEQFLFFHEYQKTRAPGLRKNLGSALLAIKKSLFMSSEGFRGLARAEDMEFTERLQKGGQKLYFTPQIVAYRIQKLSLFAIFKKNFWDAFFLYTIHYAALTPLKKGLFLLGLPLLSFLKSLRIIARNLMYCDGARRFISVCFAPLLLIAGIFWMLGMYAGFFSKSSSHDFRKEAFF